MGNTSGSLRSTIFRNPLEIPSYEFSFLFFLSFSFLFLYRSSRLSALSEVFELEEIPFPPFLHGCTSSTREIPPCLSAIRWRHTGMKTRKWRKKVCLHRRTLEYRVCLKCYLRSARALTTTRSLSQHDWQKSLYDEDNVDNVGASRCTKMKVQRCSVGHYPFYC